jgi:hypothetical protein
MKTFSGQMTWVLLLEASVVCITQMKKPKTISSLKNDSDIDPNCVGTVPSRESDTADLEDSDDLES